MAYSVKMFNQTTGEFHSYMQVRDRSEWATVRTAAKHAKEFASSFPGIVCAVVDAETDVCVSKVTGLSFSSDALRLYSDAGCLLVPASAVRLWLLELGLPDGFSALGADFTKCITTKRDVMAKIAAG